MTTDKFFFKNFLEVGKMIKGEMTEGITVISIIISITINFANKLNSNEKEICNKN